MFRSVFFAAAVVACGTANAATIWIDQSAPNVFSIYLDGEGLNGSFNPIIFKATPNNVRVQLFDNVGTVLQELNVPYFLDNTPLGPFANLNNGFSAGAPRPAGQAHTYFNRMLDADPLEFPSSLGWITLSVVRTSSELSFVGGLLNGLITTANQPNDRLFLANIYAPPVPEPATFGLVGMAMLGLAALRRPTSDPAASVYGASIPAIRSARIMSSRSSQTIPIKLADSGKEFGRRAGWYLPGAEY